MSIAGAFLFEVVLYITPYVRVTTRLGFIEPQLASAVDQPPGGKREFIRGRSKETRMDTTTLLIVILVLLLLFGGGWYGRGRWY